MSSIQNTKTLTGLSNDDNTFAVDLIPSLTNTFDIGVSAYRWRNVWTQFLQVTNDIFSATIQAVNGFFTNVTVSSALSASSGTLTTLNVNGGTLGTSACVVKGTTSGDGVSIEASSGTKQYALVTSGTQFRVLEVGSANRAVYHSTGYWAMARARFDRTNDLSLTTAPVATLVVGDAVVATGKATIAMTGPNTDPETTALPCIYHRHNVGFGLSASFDMSIQTGSGLFGNQHEAMYINATTAGAQANIYMDNFTTRSKIIELVSTTFDPQIIDSEQLLENDIYEWFLDSSLAGPGSITMTLPARADMAFFMGSAVPLFYADQTTENKYTRKVDVFVHNDTGNNHSIIVNAGAGVDVYPTTINKTVNAGDKLAFEIVYTFNPNFAKMTARFSP